MIVDRRGPARDNRFKFKIKDRGKYPCLQSDLGWFQGDGVWNFHMDRSIETECSANLPGLRNLRCGGGGSSEEGAIMTADQIARVLFTPPQCHQPRRERQGIGAPCPNHLVPVHCPPDRIVSAAQA